MGSKKCSKIIAMLFGIYLTIACSAAIVHPQQLGLLADILTVNQNQPMLNVSTLCQSELKRIATGIQVKEIWAKKLLDASGYFDSGFTWGNNYWLGSQRACGLVNEPVRIILSDTVPKNHRANLTEIASPMPVVYKVVWAKHNSKWQLDIRTFDKTITHIGLCVPQACTNEDINQLATVLLNNDDFKQKYIFEGNFTRPMTKSLILADDFYSHPMVYLFICILFTNLVLVVVSAIFYTIKNNYRTSSEEELENSQKTSRNMSNTEMKKARQSLGTRILSSYCVKTNSSIITGHDLGSDSIPCIHGLRALGMIWIICGHLFFYGPGAIDNVQMTLIYAEAWYLQPLFATAMSVDTYFVISGLVLSYLFFQEEKKQKKISPLINFASSVINRYMRLTPSYLVTITLVGFVSTYLRDTSPFWMTEANDINCPQYWWRNFLYIQNMYPIEDMCMSWSWYLASDFQCFVLSSFLLTIYTKLPKLAVTLFALVFAICSGLVGYLSYSLSYTLSLDVQYSTIDYLYTPSYTRITPYFIGVYAGYFLSRYERKFDISKKLLTLGWIVCPTLLIALVFGTTKKELSPLVAVLFSMFGKTAWGVGCAWIIVACTCGRGGIVDKILNAKCLLPLSRMSYTAYLLNPLCITFIVMSQETPVHLDFTSFFMYSIAFQVLVFSLSYVFMLVFENPFIRLGKLLQGK